MKELLDAFPTWSWASFGTLLLVFGFAPGAVLRVLVHAYPPDDPRRDELIGELYAVPRLNRPMWVAEQLEVALFEGLPERLWWAAAGRITYRWQLVSGVERNRQYPETFSVPSEQEKAELRVGDLVKLSFELRKSREGDRMWVEITGIGRRGYKGLLCNTAVMIPRLEGGRRIGFRSEHIIDWMTAEDAATHDADAAGSGSPIA